MKRILVSDDDQAVTSAVQILLQDIGQFAIEIVDNPEATLDSLAARKPDLLLLNLNYGPGKMTGRDIIRIVRGQFSEEELPTVVMTGLSQSNYNEIIAMGVTDVIFKPFHFQKFREIVQKALEG